MAAVMSSTEKKCWFACIEVCVEGCMVVAKSEKYGRTPPSSGGEMPHIRQRALLVDPDWDSDQRFLTCTSCQNVFCLASG